MDIKIVTMNSAYNYGAMLQAYGLQETIKSLSCNPKFIDQRGLIKRQDKKSLKSLIYFLFGLKYKKEVLEGHAKFDDFIKHYQSLTEENYYNYEKLKTNPPKADMFIAGSDQVWNPGTLRPINFLEFVKDGTKKISYAASLGVSKIPELKKDKFKRYIEDFDSISMREEQGKNEVQELTNKKVEVHFDPVFLLNRSEWQKIGNKIDEINYPYILCYILYRPKWLNKYLKKLRKKTGLKVILVCNEVYRNVYHNKMIRNAGPLEFLWLMDNAEIVITSSFHGTAFASIFNKPFYTMVNPTAPARISNLMNKLQFSERLLFEGNKFEFQDINYSEVNKTIDNERRKAVDYLKKSIGK